MITQPLPLPDTRRNISADSTIFGPPIPPIERIRLFGHREWEEFVLEWADSLREKYSRVDRCGGAGDMGRDVVAWCKDDENQWDNYQCKHYGAPLTRSDILEELGKLVFYTSRGEYTYPRRYYFVAPQGGGTALLNLFRKPESLRKDLIESWAKNCRTHITRTAHIELDGPLLTHLNSLDFSIFEVVPQLRVIDEHAKTPWHLARFGGGLPARPSPEPPPLQPSANEATYLRQLLDAYGDHLGRPVPDVIDLQDKVDLVEHLQEARIEFYSAESLRSFSRDTLPPGEFDKLQDEVRSAIGDEIRAKHDDGYRRLLAVVRFARVLPLSAHALVPRLHVRDRGGICHQLANGNKIRWVK